jgi:hypothetical protein
MHRDYAIPWGLFSQGAMDAENLVGLGTTLGGLDPAAGAAMEPVEHLFNFED